MARLNEILVGRFAKFYQKFYGIKGPVPVATLAPEIMPVHPIFSGVENRYIEGWNHYFTVFNLTGIAGQNANVRIRNPKSSNVAAVVYKWLICVAATQAVDIAQNVNDVNLATVEPSTPFDKRLLLQNSSIVPSQSTSTIAIGPIIFTTFLLANTPFDFISDANHEIPLMPGSAYDVQTQTVATQLLVSMWWRERALEEPERI